MSSIIKKFTYDIHKMKKRDDPLFDPFVQLTLADWGTAKGSNAPLVSATLASEAEIDEHIKNLKDDLDAVGKAAKTALRKAREQTMSFVNERNENR